MRAPSLTYPCWEPWSTELSPLGQTRPTQPIPSNVLVTEPILSHAPYVALEERVDGSRFAELFGIRFQVIAHCPDQRLFGLRRV